MARKLRIRKSLVAIAGLGLTLSILGACGDGDGDDGGGPYGTSDDEGATSPENSPETSPDAGGDGMAELQVHSSDVGDILTDADGMVLYLFTQDSDGTSTCYDECAENWPPMIVEETPEVGEGIDESLLGITERDDGSQQVTYNDHPLYYWQGDESAGDMNGQGVNSVWYVLDPDGEAVEETTG
ncbi:COG4315 family predicted lipoprotein [Haloglycomyces albus]|uniref:COG4315 family predicted lipoprotein n=1 Tax=Haloglycomyces albus TaxID=526067 RepID=UPI00046C8C91|nr:hypothetical protein [Haloglycomyces albus]